MQPEERNQFAERWLDQALAHYSDAEPRPGLESRVLANLHAAKSARTHAARWPWVSAGCAAVLAVTIVIASLLNINSAPHAVFSAPAPTAAVHSAEPNDLAPTPAAQPTPRRQRSRKTLVVKDAEPRQPQFPADTALTEQQRLLLAFVRSTPPEELARISAEQREWRERVESGARATEQPDQAPGPNINDLNFPPLERGTTDTGAFGAR